MVHLVELDASHILLPDYRGRLLEGATYNPSNNTLIWVDIITGEIHRLSLNDQQQHEVLKFDDPSESVGAIGLTSNDNVIIVCAKYGVAKGNFVTKEIKYFLKYNHDTSQQQRLRSNDGIIDPWGHLWIGVMTDFDTEAKDGKVSPEGKLYRINCHDLTVETMIDNTYISNGLLFSSDGKKLYWTDSLTHQIWEFDYAYITNNLSNRRKYIDIRDVYTKNPSHVPDGLSMTKNKELFTAVYGSSSVLHFDHTTQCVGKIKLPAERITSVTLGGKNNNELFITTAHPRLTDLNHKIDANDKTGDLGGFLYHYLLDRPFEALTKSIWGGKV